MSWGYMNEIGQFFEIKAADEVVAEEVARERAAYFGGYPMCRPAGAYEWSRA